MLESHFENEALYWRIALALKLHPNFSIYYGNQLLEFQHAVGIGFQFNK